MMGMEATPMTYRVIDIQTGFVIGTYSSRRRAAHKAYKLDLIYGAIRYAVKAVQS